ncbi:DUF2694 family protein [Mycobacterium sp.]|uniref:DUF2694 family protein n=1 Tax=Mycobacterium sp. TaxID=1785 RepID=UPI0028B7327D|nr:hypothetical protein [Mycobacterium sp.]MDT5057000.1 hypothetical protein [Mycobacterium sp.]
MTDEHAVALSDQSFTAATPDGSVFVRVAVRGHVLGVQLEPEAMGRPGHEIAERIMACADVAYFQGQVAVRRQWEQAGIATDDFAGIPTEADLAAARERLGKL